MLDARELFLELKRRKVIRVAIAYAVVAWLVLQVAEVTFEPLQLPGWALTLVVVLAILGFPVAIVLAWAFEVTPGGLRRDAAALPAMAAEAPPASVAVLPFVDMSESQDQGYFCDGIAEEILSALAQVRGLSVAARTSSFRFRGPSGDIAEIARSLNVATVLEGSVRKAGERLRVTAQLVTAKDGFHLWSDRFDVGTSDVFAVQDSIAAAIVDALRVSLHAEDRQLMQSGRTRSIEAYDHYLRGLSHFHAFNMRRMEHARQMFLKAIEIDPQFGRAWAGLAYAAGYLYLYRVRDEEYRRAALDASAQALQCCDTAEAHTARAVALWLSRDYEAAEPEFRRALELNPDLYEALWLYGRMAHERGDYAKAAEVWERATHVNSGDYQAALLLPQVFVAMKQPEKARHWWVQGLARAERHLDAHPDDARALYLAAVTYAELGQVEEARRAAERALRLEPDDGIVAYNLGCMYAALGEPDRAVDLLERGAAVGGVDYAWLEHDASLDPLRGHPRFEALRVRLSSRATPAATG